MKPKSKILIIAGSDSSGGAGIQADIKTVTSLGSYAMTAITAVTAQNTTGVKSIAGIDPKEISKQILFTCRDIKPDAIKIGMLHSESVINSVINSLKSIGVTKIILDPVMIAKGGARLINNKAINNDAIEIAKDTGLLDYFDTKSDNLSYGLQRQLELGIAISCNPKLLLLDEPTAGMSPAETKEIIKLIKKLSAKYSIIIVEHDMDVIYELANRIYVLDRGTLIFEGDAKSVKSSELVQNKYLGI